MFAPRLTTSNRHTRRLALLAVAPLLWACDRASTNDAGSADSTVLDRATDAPTAVAFADSLAPVQSWYIATEAALRENPGTARADSTFIALRASLSDSVNKAVAGLDSAAATPAVMRQRGVAVWEIEGFRSYSPSEGYLLERLGPLLTEPMREYLALRAREQDGRAATEGALAISYEELLDRLRATDAFARANETHMLASSARGQANSYLAFALAGSDNFPVFDRSTGLFSESYRASLEQFVRNNPGSAAASEVERFLALLRENAFRRTQRVESFLEQLWSSAETWVFE